ncbi:type II secretion system F family protein [Halalkalibacillus sediminis]|uniref:Type II secretion system F family protein n=1 Tax=Halalkalibacillus sediminis TaxID=2018042 RepID=A0A2I0QRI1_9BACI|nr:type II secretion system F family protein [Halalkalibacillus sediminis]PKR76941.1 type II secretion system F family protein [Halalkalibacillus sediminis]
MASFKYVAANYSGSTIKGKMEAFNEDQARKMLKDDGLKVETLHRVEESIWNKDLHIGNPVKNQDLVAFLQQFGALLRAGLTVVESLSILREQTSNKELTKALYYIEIDMRQGTSLAKAMGKHSRIFPTILINMVHSGEASGTLDETLVSLGTYYNKQHKTKQKVKSALAYPITVVIVAIFVVIFLMLYVVPQFVDMFAQFDAELPMITKFVLAVSNIITNYWLLLLLITLGIILGVVMIYQKEQARVKFDEWALKVPIFGKLVQKSNLAKMTRSLSSLLYNSVPIIQAIQLTEETIKNRVIKHKLIESRQALRKGNSMVSPMKGHWAFPYLVTQMISVGERTGSLEEMLDQVASFYEDDVETTTDQLKSLIEPLLIITLSIIVGTIVLAIIVPMFEIFNQVN